MIRTASGALPRLVAALVALVVAGPVAPAAAAEPTSPTVTWAVQPADERGPDGRRWVETTLDPGQVVTEHLAVRNFSDSAVVFSLQAADGYLTDKGRFNMLAADQQSVDGGTWIDVQETVTVGAGQTTVVPFTITVPPDATPGDHPAGVAATITSGAGTVAVQSRVGFRLMLRASGTVTAALAVSDLAVRYQRSWNPFTAGTVHVGYTATNAGNVAVTGAGRVRVAELFGATGRDVRGGVAELLPGGGRQVQARVDGVWGWGRLTTTVEVTPSVVAGDPTGAEIRPGAATVTVWTLPWPQLALAAVIIALLFAYRAIARRRRRHLAQLLADARDEGWARARAAVGGSPIGSTEPERKT
ncbi:hypothetical protein [Micromonospora sp. WMMD1082]|uniref:hypothetical protein n=1 Tax=Micromonospora sp. WMMD1082 TaxID=3016104 RepID=UPI002417133C|nr:hypothetical protein [Micromonospora sp. WMMD1082]MDG4798031.1 hypothetical protein [Micromonospora sp. WMMD1082]